MCVLQIYPRDLWAHHKKVDGSHTTFRSSASQRAGGLCLSAYIKHQKIHFIPVIGPPFSLSISRSYLNQECRKVHQSGLEPGSAAYMACALNHSTTCAPHLVLFWKQIRLSEFLPGKKRFQLNMN